MKIAICSSSLLLLAAIMCSNFEPSIEDIFPVSRNFMIFERYNCSTFDSSKASDIKCPIKRIDRNHLKGLMSVNLTKPVTGLWLHAAGYYKYNTYMKIATEISEDLCGWLDGRRLLLGKADNISVQQFAFPQIMPAGRYRLDMNVTQGQSALFGGSIYFAISDHRVEIV